MKKIVLFCVLLTGCVPTDSKFCELCGKCHILKGRDPESLYADYINGKRSYIDVTLSIRNNNR